MKEKRSSRNRSRRQFFQTAIYLLIAGAVIVGLKFHYSRAGSESLGWVLKPTAWLVGSVSGISFEKEAGAGFVSLDHGVAIAPSCAGVNFMIAAFCTVVFACIGGSGRFIFKLAWIGLGVPISYCATLAVNTARIILSIHLYQATIYTGWLTPDRVHRAAGILLYLTALCLLYYVASAAASGMKRKRRQPGGGVQSRWLKGWALPFGCYLLVTVAIPVIHSAGLNKPLPGAEHCWMVAAGCLLVAAAVYGVHKGKSNLKPGGIL